MFLLLLLKLVTCAYSFSTDICLKHMFSGFSIIGEALGSGECQWIYDTTCHPLNQTSHTDSQDLLEV